LGAYGFAGCAALIGGAMRWAESFLAISACGKLPGSSNSFT
jgi:hypothetical protein